MSVEELKKKSISIRTEVFTRAYRTKSGHLGSSFSIIDILVCLYFGYLKVDPANPLSPSRDRFILSKGHGCSSLYSVLADRGFFPKEELSTFLQDNSRLPGHPSSLLVPGIEASTGSLGHGLCIGVGMALAAQRDNASCRTVVLLSDGECDEGSTWEAILSAGHWHLGNLICIVDYNKIQSFGFVKDVMGLEPFAEKWRAFGWYVQEVNGHNHDDILQGLEKASEHRDQPSVIIAHTVKGKGISFMENKVEWHYWPPSPEQYRVGISELSHSL